MAARHILTLAKKDILLETRQQYTFYGILLYVASTTFIIYLTAGKPEETTWNALFWMVQLFVCINAVAKSFTQEGKERILYYYSIAGPRDYIISKLLYNALLMLIMVLLSLGLFCLLLGNPLYSIVSFAGISLLGGTGLSFVFTFLAAIASQTKQQGALMAIMGFPIVVPQLFVLSKLANASFAPVVQEGYWTMIALLAGLDIMTVVLALILFPFLWID